jgi:hypothetical protein
LPLLAGLVRLGKGHSNKQPLIDRAHECIWNLFSVKEAEIRIGLQALEIKRRVAGAGGPCFSGQVGAGRHDAA